MSLGRVRGISEREGYENDDNKLRHGRIGAQRPLPRGYQPHPHKMQPHPTWEGRYNPGYYQQSSSSFARGSYCWFRSLVLYGRLVEQRAWWSKGREEQDRSKPTRYDDYLTHNYGIDHVGYDYNAYDNQRGGWNMPQQNPVTPLAMNRRDKTKSNMEAPTKCPQQLDKYCTCL